jgi:hypothetical protein
MRSKESDEGNLSDQASGGGGGESSKKNAVATNLLNWAAQREGNILP